MLSPASSGFPAGAQGLGAAPELQGKNTLTEFSQAVASTLVAKPWGTMKCSRWSQ